MVAMSERRASVAAAVFLATGVLVVSYGTTFLAPTAPLRAPSPHVGSRRAEDSSKGLCGFAPSMNVGIATMAVAALVTMRAAKGKGTFHKLISMSKAELKVSAPTWKGKEIDIEWGLHVENVVGHGLATGRHMPVKKYAPRSVYGIIWPGMEMESFSKEDFVTSEKAELDWKSAKEVGSYMSKPEVFDDFTVPAQVPSYQPWPAANLHLMQDPGYKRRPRHPDDFFAYNEVRSNVLASAKKAAANSLDQDIICDREVLMNLLEYVNGDWCKTMNAKGNADHFVDVVKISKSGKTLVLDNLYQKSDLIAEFRPKRSMGGAYNQFEKNSPNDRGPYITAAHRWAAGAETFRMPTGQRGLLPTTKVDTTHIVPEMQDDPNPCFKFVELKSGGLSFLIRAPKELMKNDECVELTEHPYLERDTITKMHLYQQLALGKQDHHVTVFHTEGDVKQVVETSTATMMAESPAVVEAAERRFGMVIALLKKVSAELANKEDGPWALQWRKGRINLGKYEKVQIPDEFKKEPWLPRGKPKPNLRAWTSPKFD